MKHVKPILMLVLMWTSISVFNLEPVIQRIFIHKTTTVYVKHSAKTFTKEKFIRYLKDIRIKFPEVVYAQAVQETGFKSNVFKTKCNLFGMKVAGVRIGIGKGKLGELAEYNTWQESVLDYAFWQMSKQKKVNTVEDYLKLLKPYAKDQGYINKIRRISTNYKYLFQ